VRHTLATLALVALTLGTSGCGGDDGPAGSGSGSSFSSQGASETAVLRLEPGPAAKCLMPSARALKGLDVAFSGTVTSVEGNEATLDVDHWYAGGDEPRAVVRTSERTISEPGLFDLEKGQRYLISGSRGTVSLCGFSAPWSPDLERLYAQAFANS
jgi:hypothetical protein